jgi:uncharacterized protein (DUF1800 family)
MGDPIASRADVSRLLGRCAFGATSAQLDQWTGQSYSSLVDSLVNVPPVGSATRLPQTDEVIRLKVTQQNDLAGGQQWWLGRMGTTPYPLEERLTLFWHDHFATAVQDQPDAQLVLQQNQTLRTNALGNFRTMCQQITIDAAMLQWLNGDASTATKPNENYGREFFELFSLGTIPQVYTETDIRQSARALTGWTVDATTLQGKFVAARHATDTKTVLGTSVPNQGATEYQAIIDIALAQPVSAKYIAYKLVQQLAYVPTTHDLFNDPDPLVDEVAASLAASNWNLQTAVRTLLMSDNFRSADPAAGHQAVRTPAEIAVHAGKVAGVATNNTSLTGPMARCGQKLLQPPNVGGWPVGRGWLSTTTALARYELAVTVTNIRNGQNANLRTAFPPSTDIDAGGSQWASFMGLAAFEPATLAALQGYVTGRRGQSGSSEAELQTGIFILVVTSPDWEVM